MSKLLEAFGREGGVLEVGGNVPVLLEDPDDVWFVVSGSVHVFVVDVENDEAKGPRDYLFTVASGGILLGMEPEWAAEAGLLGAGTAGTQILHLPMNRFRELVAGDPGGGSTLIEDYIGAFSSAIARRSRRRFDVLLGPGDSGTTEPGAAIAALRRPVWVTLESGRGLFDGSEGLPVGLEDAPFPISTGAWILSAEPLSLLAEDTATVLEQGRLWNGLRSFQRVGLEWAVETLERDRAEESDRFRARVEADRQASHHALAGLTTLMEPEGADTTATVDEPMFAACQLVGRALGLKIQPAAAWETRRSAGDELRAIARASSVGHRRVVLSPDWWKKDNGPLLGFRTGGPREEERTPVALLPRDATSYEVHDVCHGWQSAVDEEVDEVLEPFAYSFYRPLPAEAVRPLDLLRFVVFGLGRDIRTILAMGVVGSVLGLLAPILTGHLFDNVIPTADGVQLFHLFLALVVVGLSGTMFRLTRSIAALRLQSRAIPALQMAVLDRLTRLPLPFFRQFSAGDLGMRAAGINQIGQALSGATVTTILSSIVSASSFVLLFYYSLPLALLATGILLVVVMFTAATAHYMLRYERELQDVEGRLTGLVLQFLTGIAKLRVSGTEARAFAQWSGGFRTQRALRFRIGRFQNNVEVFNSILTIASTLAIYWFYTVLATNPEGGLTTGAFLAFNAAYGTFMGAGLDLTMTSITLLQLVPTWARSKPILESVPEADRSRPDPGEIKGHIEVSHLALRYHEDGPLVLRDVSLEAEAGEFIAIVGPSGAGKSTLLRVLLGFEIPDSNSVFYDGHDLAAIDVCAVRRQIGVVLQSSRLTAGDVFTNIIGSSSLTRDDAMEAIRMAGMEEDLAAMPMGLHTVISEGGGTLSGGQKQRLLIARALVTKPRILFFDEATSALDNRTQEIVSSSVERLHATRVVIAHRISTIRNASRIYVLDQGRTVQVGSFEELVSQPGLFADLAARQEA